MSSRNNKPLIPNAWYSAAWSDVLAASPAGQQPLARTIMNYSLALFRDAAGEPAAPEDRSCHRGAQAANNLIHDMARSLHSPAKAIKKAEYTLKWPLRQNRISGLTMVPGTAKA